MAACLLRVEPLFEVLHAAQAALAGQQRPARERTAGDAGYSER
jgi:hypothetical protein